MNKKKITILALHLGYGGIERFISSLCSMLIDKYDIDIISTYKVTEKPVYNFDNRINIKYLIDDKPNKEDFKLALKSKNIIYIFKEGFKAISLLNKKKKYNIEAIKNIKSDYIITTRDFHNELVGKYANKDIIKIATEHNYPDNDQKYINRLIKSVENMDYFVLVSKELCEFYSKLVKPKCIYIPNVLDKLTNKESKCDNHNIVSAGRLEPEKGYMDLLKVVLKVKKQIPDIKLNILGEGSEREELEQFIKDNNLEENIKLPGFKNVKEMEEYYLDSSIFVSTSLKESFGLAVLEASSYKLPIVAFSSAKGLVEILEKNSGILIGNRNIEIMTNNIIELLNNKEKRNELRINSFNNSKRFLADNVKKEWEDLLNEKLLEK